MDREYAAKRAKQVGLSEDLGRSIWDAAVEEGRSKGMTEVSRVFRRKIEEAVTIKREILNEDSTAYIQAMSRLRLLRAGDVFIIVKMLTEPFTQWPAYKAGLIDRNGKVLRRPETSEDLDALPPMAMLVLLLKRDMVPAKQKQNWSSYPTAWRRVFMLGSGELKEDMGGLTSAAVQGPATPFVNKPVKRTKPK